MRIILASQSAFRKKALDILGLKYETIPSGFCEKSIRNRSPLKLAMLLSEAKAKEIGSKESDAIIIAGDLFVVFKGDFYEKPEDENEAFDMLSSFSGHRIDIVAGVAVYNSKTGKMLSTVEKYTVKFRKLQDYEIKDYISRYPVLKFAGAFDGDGLLRFSESIRGKYPFLTGVPMDKLIIFLRANDLKV